MSRRAQTRCWNSAVHQKIHRAYVFGSREFAPVRNICAFREFCRLKIAVDEAQRRSSRRIKQRSEALTFLERSPLVFFQSLHRDGFQSDPSRRILLQNVPHVLLAEDEEVRVAHRTYTGCSPVTCVDVAIYWLSGCIKLSVVSARNRSIDRPIVPLSYIDRVKLVARATAHWPERRQTSIHVFALFACILINRSASTRRQRHKH